MRPIVTTGFKILLHSGAHVLLFAALMYLALFIPGSPPNRVFEAMEPMAGGNPSDAEVDAWFDSAAAGVLFMEIILPVAVAGIYSAWVRYSSPKAAVVGGATVLSSVGLLALGAFSGALLFALTIFIAFHWRGKSHAEPVA